MVDDKFITNDATSSNQIINLSESENINIINNENIFSDEQKAYIISKFPEKLHEYLNKVNNPLDETQVIISLLKERNIRIVLNYEENIFGIYEWRGYYHATDIENELGCSRVDNWSRNWNIKFKKFNEFENKNLVPQIEGPFDNGPIYNFDIKKVDINANFIDDEGLKTILIKTTKKGKEIDLFKEWIIKYSTIAKSVISIVIQIKLQYEMEQLKNKNNNRITCDPNEITYFYEINDVTPYLNLNVIYFGDTGEVVVIDGITYKIYKIGLSHRSIERDFKEHKKTFAAYKMVHIKHCDNNIVVELYLKMELKAKNLIYELPKKSSNDGNKKLLNDKNKKAIEDEDKEDEDNNVSKNNIPSP